MKANILTLAITLTVGIILTGSLLMPVITDATKDPAVLDVVIIDGQSNAEYAGGYANATELNANYTEAPYTNLYYYGHPWGTPNINDSYTTYEVHNMYANGAYTLGGYGPALANTIAHRDGHDVYYVSFGVGGKSIAELLPGTTAGTWGFGILDAALAAMPTGYDKINYVGVGWAQGEADKTMAVDTYKGYFETLQAAFAERGFNEIYIIETRETYGGNATIAQQELIDSVPHVHMGATIQETFVVGDGNLIDSDPVHYSQKGRIAIAIQLGETVALPTYDTVKLELLYVIPIIVIIGLVVFATKAMVSKYD